MSVMLRTHAIDALDDIFIFYDFQQVRDVIMIVAFIEKLSSWEKIFIYYNEDRWNIESLSTYFDDKKFNWICNNINIILQHREESKQFDGIDINKEMKDRTNFFFDLNELR